MNDVFLKVRALDPRWYQIACLTSLLLYGIVVLRFDLSALQAGVTIATALGTQLACTKLWRLPRFEPKSALISSLSLCLLLRTNFLWLAAAAAVIAISSKFILRLKDKHILNPTNGALVILLIAGAPIWVSPGQWGNVAFFAFLMACLGGLVVMRSARSDVAVAFLVFWCIGLFGRSLWLGEPMTIPAHRLESGALLLFAFFMISDPKTTPDSRAGRILFAFLVAFGAWWIQFKMFRTNGLLWSLAGFSLVVPLIDRLLPGSRYDWSAPGSGSSSPLLWRIRMRASAPVSSLLGVVVVGSLLAAGRADAFCGFYVAKADAKLFNQASQVVLVRDEDKTVLTMANDYQGKLKEFAVVVPVPTSITREQIHIGDMKVVEHLDNFTVPRLVEYHDSNPCAPPYEERIMPSSAPMMQKSEEAPREARARALGVTIEASYTVGEYDILILSAKQSNGLVTWLTQEGYKIPEGAGPVVDSYLKQNMKWFVAKVNLKEHDKLGGGKLRPIQVAYESPKFMLPIRLGTVNSNGTQDVIVYAITKAGRVESTNYRTVKLPSDVNIPEYTKDEFGDFYKAMFANTVNKNDMRAVITEYAWDMSWCDPCAADPLSTEELKGLGVWWIGQGDGYHGYGGQNAFVTRLHVRYDRAHFPEDLVFQTTNDRQNFQGRYVMQHPFTGPMECEAAGPYLKQVWERQQQEAKTLADLTGWNVADIKKKMKLADKAPEVKGKKWYDRLWK